MTATILVVEDEFLVRLLVCETLREEGFSIMEAADADEAWDVLESSPPVGLLLTDIRMPGSMDGLGLARRVRRSHPTMKIMFLSSHTSEPSILRWGDAFVSKPYDSRRLVAQIRTLLEPPRVW